MRVANHLMLLAAIALMLPVGAAARSKNEHKVQLTSPAQVGTTQLAPGTYKVEWKGNGPAVHVDFIRNNKTVATTPARWVTEAKPSPYDSVVLKKTADNHNRLVELDFHNDKQVLQITPTRASNRGSGM